METAPRRSRLGYSSVLLGIVAMVAGAALTFAHVETAGPIAAQMAADRKASLKQVIPPALHDNDLLKDAVEIDVGHGERKTFYRAMRHGKVTAVAYEMIAHGYGGEILLLMGVDRNGAILGVRVLSQHETPGLGDKIDLKKTHWILGFDHRSLGNPDEKGWHVKKDGGVFDQFTGATITPRGVVKGVHAGLELFAAHKDQLLDAAPAATGAENGNG